MTGYKHKTQIQVRFKDVDMMGHINNADFFSYVELARLKYFDTVIGTDSDWHDQHGLILAHFEIDFKTAASFDDNISVYTKCSRLGNKSFELSWVMVNEPELSENEVVLAEGKAVIACYDYHQNKSIPIPEERRKLIIKFEGEELK
jgi:acyl-CoA thioester hydrolase